MPFLVPQRKDALFRPRSFFVAPRAAKRGLELTGLESIEQGLRLEQPATSLRAHGEGLRTVGKRFLVAVDDQPRPNRPGVVVAKFDHLAELVGGVHVQQRKRDAPGIERLLREPKQDRGVLADRVEHHRPLELCDHFPDDVDALGFERAQVVEAKELGLDARTRERRGPGRFLEIPR